VSASASVDILTATVRQFRDEGGTQEVALAVLNAVRTNAPRAAHPPLLELIDWVSDWSAPHMKSWDDPIDD
jgi:hypothetical protein